MPFARSAPLALFALSLSACSGAGVGDVLGSVLGGGAAPANQVSGTVQGVDTRSQRLVLRQSNGQNVSLAFDNETQVVYQNQQYAVTNLEQGDVVTARIQDAGNGVYYTDLVQVDQSVTTSSSGGSVSNENVQALQGTVRQVDRTNGWFTLDTGGGALTVTLPYNIGRSELNTFQNLRSGDRIRLYGVFLNNTRVELRQFY
jgi:hypothetical protein